MVTRPRRGYWFQGLYRHIQFACEEELDGFIHKPSSHMFEREMVDCLCYSGNWFPLQPHTNLTNKLENDKEVVRVSGQGKLHWIRGGAHCSHGTRSLEILHKKYWQ